MRGYIGSIKSDDYKPPMFGCATESTPSATLRALATGVAPSEPTMGHRERTLLNTERSLICSSSYHSEANEATTYYKECT